MAGNASPAVPVLALDHACLAEARRALAADELVPEPIDDAWLVRLLLSARALPIALDAALAAGESEANLRLLAPAVEGALEPSRAPLRAFAVVDTAAGRVEVRFAKGERADELVESDAHVLSRVVFPCVMDAGSADADEDSGVRIQRFGHGPTPRR